MNADPGLYLGLLAAYLALQVAIGVWLGRRVKTAGAFFVAGRQLGPGLMFATLVAANIGAGSTLGAAGEGYRLGIGAWW
jgi:SSS family solute:Na+ symporter